MSEAWALLEDGIVIEAQDADQLVPWWSFTKTVLAAAALALVREGLLSLEDHLPGKPYCLRHLLQHRSGLVDYGGSRAYHEAVARGDDPWSVPQLLENVEADRLRYPTGDGWEYSNIGYLFVRQLIEDATHAELNVALQRLVLKPLGIESAYIASKPADLELVAMGSARSYHPGWVYHGLMVGSVKDAAMLLHHLMIGRLISPEMVQEMLSPFMLPGPIPERPWQVPGYGLGLMTGETTAGKYVAGHTGGGPGSTVAVYCALDQGSSLRTAAVFALSEDAARTEEQAFNLLRA